MSDCGIPSRHGIASMDETKKRIGWGVRRDIEDGKTVGRGNLINKTVNMKGKTIDYCQSWSCCAHRLIVRVNIRKSAS